MPTSPEAVMFVLLGRYLSWKPALAIPAAYWINKKDASGRSPLRGREGHYNLRKD